MQSRRHLTLQEDVERLEKYALAQEDDHVMPQASIRGFYFSMPSLCPNPSSPNLVVSERGISGRKFAVSADP